RVSIRAVLVLQAANVVSGTCEVDAGLNEVFARSSPDSIGHLQPAFAGEKSRIIGSHADVGPRNRNGERTGEWQKPWIRIVVLSVLEPAKAELVHGLAARCVCPAKTAISGSR